MRRHGGEERCKQEAARQRSARSAKRTSASNRASLTAGGSYTGNASSAGAYAYWVRCRLRDLGEAFRDQQTALSVIPLTQEGWRSRPAARSSRPREGCWPNAATSRRPSPTSPIRLASPSRRSMRALRSKHGLLMGLVELIDEEANVRDRAGTVTARPSRSNGSANSVDYAEGYRPTKRPHSSAPQPATMPGSSSSTPTTSHGARPSEP